MVDDTKVVEGDEGDWIWDLRPGQILVPKSVDQEPPSGEVAFFRTAYFSPDASRGVPAQQLIGVTLADDDTYHPFRRRIDYVVRDYAGTNRFMDPLDDFLEHFFHSIHSPHIVRAINRVLYEAAYREKGFSRDDISFLEMRGPAYAGQKDPLLRRFGKVLWGYAEEHDKALMTLEELVEKVVEYVLEQLGLSAPPAGLKAPAAVVAPSPTKQKPGKARIISLDTQGKGEVSGPEGGQRVISADGIWAMILDQFGETYEVGPEELWGKAHQRKKVLKDMKLAALSEVVGSADPTKGGAGCSLYSFPEVRVALDQSFVPLLAKAFRKYSLDQGTWEIKGSAYTSPKGFSEKHKMDLGILRGLETKQLVVKHTEKDDDLRLWPYPTDSLRRCLPFIARTDGFVRIPGLVADEIFGTEIKWRSMQEDTAGLMLPPPVTWNTISGRASEEATEIVFKGGNLTGTLHKVTLAGAEVDAFFYVLLDGQGRLVVCQENITDLKYVFDLTKPPSVT